jgi:hypothetical protein
MLVLPWRGRDREKQEVLGGEEASSKARETSGEAAEEYSEQALGLFSSSTAPSYHQNF